jgi:hypothetical protein
MAHDLLRMSTGHEVERVSAIAPMKRGRKSSWRLERRWKLFRAVLLYETPTVVTIKLAEKDRQLVYDAEYNVAFGATREAQLVGKREKLK